MHQIAGVLQRGMIRRLLLPGLCSTLLFATGVSAQFSGDPGINPNQPGLLGQWAGPYPLGTYMNPDPENAEWAELVHMTTLPPPNDGYVLLWARRNRGKGSTTPAIILDYETWLWTPGSPNSLTTIPVPGTSTGSLDLFCGSQTLLADPGGKVIATGGTDMVAWMGASVVGTAGAFEFDNAAVGSAPGPAWTQLPSLQAVRYYGAMLRESNGTITTFGPAGPGGPAGVSQQRETLGVPGWTPSDNVERVGPCADISNLYPLQSGNYPDVHLLSTGNWLRVDNGPTYVFDKIDCLGQQGPAERFVTWSAGIPGPRNYGNSVHLLYHDSGQRREVVYAIGGNDAQGCTAPFYSTVLRMADPAVGAVWTDAPPDLVTERHTANAIILLDGSILEIGGAHLVPGSTDECEPVMTVERYKPPEIFATSSGGWSEMAPLGHPRTYHSSAVLLSDGSVVVAGGVGTNEGSGPEPAWHSVEVYEPPYFFHPVRRPVIDSVQAQGPVWSYGEQNIRIDVSNLNESTEEFRVALLSPCASTHNVDFSQRYVELEVTQFSPIGGGAEIDVTAPEDGNVAPPGWYMLTVVNKEGLPSVAEWVQVGL